VRYYARGNDRDYTYFPTVAGTLIPRGFEQEEWVRRTMTGLRGNLWVLTTSDNRRMLDFVAQYGVVVVPVAHVGEDDLYGSAELYLVKAPSHR
jgi:hypothetical protein